MEFVTITSQGQMTLPAKFRKALGLKKKAKATVYLDKSNDQLVIKPVRDLMSLYGSLSHLAMKGKSIDEIIKIEERAWEDAVVEDYKRKFLKKK